MNGLRSSRGLTLIEVALALGLLSLIALLLLGSAGVLTRLEIQRVDNQAKANTLATKYLEIQRAKIDASSFVVTDLHPPDLDPGSHTPYTVDVRLVPGSVKTGVFQVNDSGQIEGTGTGATFQPNPDQAVLVTVTVTWPAEGKTKSIQRQCILAP